MRARTALALLATVCLASVMPVSASAQTSGGSLVVWVRNAGGEALHGAQVSVQNTRIFGITNARGLVRLEGVPAGYRRVRVSHVGFARAERQVDVRSGEDHALGFDLQLRVIALPEVRAQASLGTQRLANTGFYDRKALGIGSFVTRQQIENRRPRFLSDVLRTVPGVHLASTAFSDSYATMRRTPAPGRRCPIQYYLDGVLLTAGFNIDDVAPRDVEALEVYSGSSQIPAQFNRRTALCGVIVIWTRLD